MNFEPYRLATTPATRGTEMKKIDIIEQQEVIGFLKLLLAKACVHAYTHVHTGSHCWKNTQDTDNSGCLWGATILFHFVLFELPCACIHYLFKQ